MSRNADSELRANETALAVLELAKRNRRLKTASAFRVLIDIAPQLDAHEFRTVKHLAVAHATGLVHRNRVTYAIAQLVDAGIIERRRTPEGNEYRFGNGAVGIPR
jgi:hypothetical protein